MTPRLLTLGESKGVGTVAEAPSNPAHSPAALPAAVLASAPAAAASAYRERPLLIVTRPKGPAAAAVAELHAQGLRAQALPLIDIAASGDTAPLAQAWASLPSFDVVMFVSAHAVQGLFSSQPAGMVWPSSTWAASTGPGTTAALRAAGLLPHQIVQPDPDAGQFDSEALWLQLQARLPNWQGRRMLVVRGEQGRDWLADTLQDRGATVQFVAAYRRQPPCLDTAAAALLQAALAQPDAHVWLFTSSEAVAHLQALAPQANWGRSCAWATHARIAQAARDAGFAFVEQLAAGRAALVNRLQTATVLELAHALTHALTHAPVQSPPPLQSGPL